MPFCDQVLPKPIRDDAEFDRLTEVVNQLVTKGIKHENLSFEEEKLLELLVKLIEDYEREHYAIED